MKTDICTFVQSRRIILTMRNVSDKSCRENQNTHFVFSTFFSEISCRVSGNAKKSVVELDRSQMTTQYGE
jgi:hypothetical protein